MNGLRLRVALACAAIAVGVLFAAFWPAAQGGSLLPGALIGAALGIALYALVDALRGRRLLEWLRTRPGEPAPRDVGLWGEFGYRVEKLLMRGRQEVAQERTHLAQFRAAIEASPNGVLMLDRNDQIEWINSVAADQFGLDPERDVRQAVTNLVRSPAFVAHLQQGDWDAPVRVPARHGQGTLSMLIRPYGDGQKLLLSTDVSEAERADGMRRDFVANVSHEIRTPLTVVAGFIETLSYLPLDASERQRVLTLMAQQTTRMQSLVSDLLTLASLDGSPRPPTDQWVSLAQLLERAQSDAAALSAGRHRIAFDFDPTVQIAGSESEFASAIANLVNNAIRYTPDGGTIDVTWRMRSSGTGELAVVDTGVGIERHHLPRLAERFYRGDASRSRETGGTGLGLAIVKHVVQRHGGELAIQSEPGRGSTFCLRLPAARIRRMKAAAQPPQAPEPRVDQT